MTALAARAIAAEQIRYWQIRGITAIDASEALGHSRRSTSWPVVQAFMVRWLVRFGG